MVLVLGTSIKFLGSAILWKTVPASVGHSVARHQILDAGFVNGCNQLLKSLI
ncbi:MAG: hypothetical protein BTN85_0831 [Candidatus Methanohalarchaeum thermophilum]|uniref:Uncharacterized protein n=1 Tax=Methanohalarchaeum thermophilum TaxID=1903181 RepID=A0A1Q6DVE4_METT1|nr:MAG: hypothetical protein BTN85_0831 [Candidatus Methanohalarchaeum thermophilum]